jgi:LysR family glycine cleavage system transcriptional activator
MSQQDLRTPPHKALHLFFAVVRASSFADAALAHGITPSAVSHQMRALEDWVGVPLFDRTTRKPTLTPIGKVLFDGAAASALQVERVARAVCRASSAERVVISAPPAFAALRLAPALVDLRSRLPDNDVEIRTTEFGADIETEVVDIAVRFLHGSAQHDAPSTRLGMPGWSAVCTREHLAELGCPRHVRDLCDAVLVHEDIYNFWPDCLEAAGADAPQNVRFLAVGDALGTVSAALSGRVVALSPREVTADLRRRGLLVSISGGDVEPDAAFAAIPTRTGERKERVGEVIAALASALTRG